MMCSVFNLFAVQVLCAMRHLLQLWWVYDWFGEPLSSNDVKHFVHRALHNLTGLCKVLAITQIQTLKNKIHKNERKILQKITYTNKDGGTGS